MPFEFDAGDDRVTKDDLKKLLCDLNDQLNEFPTDEVLRLNGIPDPVIAALNQVGQHLDHAMALLKEEG